MQQTITTGHHLDVVCSINAFRTGPVKSDNDVDSERNVKPYRLWLRYTTAQLELRLGLQKINFGPATLMRPLMWFDRIDPRDPLQITDGVYGLLGRYYFLNNANIWLWALYGNDDPKGLELLPTVDKSIEYGGRIQSPFLNGEVALTFHRREADVSQYPLSSQKQFSENRYAVDGKWDYLLGFWLEAALIHYETDLLPQNYQKMMTVGADYTAGLGNGLHILGEHFILDVSESVTRRGQAAELSALMFDYPIGILDQVIAIFYYNWENESLYRYLSLRRAYDNWSFHLIGFWNPEDRLFIQNQQSDYFMLQKGFQVIVVYNH